MLATPEYGYHRTVYQRIRRWAKAGVLERVWKHITLLGLEARLEHSNKNGWSDVINMGGTHIKTHPKAVGRREGQSPQSIGRTKGGLNTKLLATTAGAHLGCTYTAHGSWSHKI